MEVLKEAVEKVKDCFLDDKIQMLNEKIKTVNDPMEKAKLAGEKNQLIKERGERLCQGRKQRYEKNESQSTAAGI